MLLEIREMVNKQLEERIEDLYCELGDNCPLEVNWSGMEDDYALILFKDNDFPNLELLITENLNLDNRKTEGTLQWIEPLKNSEDRKFLRKHKRTIEFIKEFWKVDFKIEVI